MQSLPWMTAEYIGTHKYNMLPMKYQAQVRPRQSPGQGSSGRYGRGSNRAEEYQEGYPEVQQSEYGAREVESREAELEEAHAKKMAEKKPPVFDDSMVDEKCTQGTLRYFEINRAQAVVHSENYGLNTCMDEKWFNEEANAKAYAITGQKEYFKEERKAASDGHRGMPRPDPESEESRAFCRSEEYYSNMSEIDMEEHKRHLEVDECSEHPSRNGKISHTGIKCCSIWHKHRHSPHKIVSYKEIKENWDAVQALTDEMAKRIKHADLISTVDSRMKDHHARSK